jgi:hypothetical protein
MDLAADIATALTDLVHVLPPLDAGRREELIASIVEGAERYGAARDLVRDIKFADPASYRVRRWKRIRTLSGTLGKLTRKMQQELAYAVDRAADHPRARTSPPIEELCDLFEGRLPLLAPLQHRRVIVLPSKTAEAFVEDILTHLKWLMVLAQSAEMLDANEVDAAQPGPPKKPPDEIRYAFVCTVSLIFRKAYRIYGIEPTAYRDGQWCQFLAKILTCCEGLPRNEDHAYKLWRKAEQWAKATIP